MKTLIADNLVNLHERIRQTEQRYHRQSGSVQLLAVSKARPSEDLLTAAACGQHHFGESYIQEAAGKITTLSDHNMQWHFIGPIQSNKTRLIATHFDWVHSVDRLKIARRLNEQRPAHMAPLNICLQVNISNEASKTGFLPSELQTAAQQIIQLPNLHLRGLMAIPKRCKNLEQQRKPFRQLRHALQFLGNEAPELDTLSMGMSSDMEAAIAEGSTIVRIGTNIFGSRN